jgi:hypothetical protein
MEAQIRFLVESYYDVQKLRVETFNRVVAYVKSNFDKFSQNNLETQHDRASHHYLETHSEDASHGGREIHAQYASQRKVETQKANASQANAETHEHSASQWRAETHRLSAVKPSIIAHEIVSGKLKPPKEISELVWYHNSLLETEKQLAKRLDGWSKHHPIRIHFLSRIRGLGPILSSGLIAWLNPVSRFSNISKIWKYCGMAPGQKRKHGEKLGYNPRLKTFMWKIASSFEKQNPEKSRYRRLYEEKKQYYLNREDLRKAIEHGEKGAKLHVRLMAMRYTVKRFLADLWVEWRRLERLPITKPYVQTVKGHTDYEPWQPDKEETYHE